MELYLDAKEAKTIVNLIYLELNKACDKYDKTKEEWYYEKMLDLRKLLTKLGEKI